MSNDLSNTLPSSLPNTRVLPKALNTAAPCPCGSSLALSACCLPLIEGAQHAATPEQLMRSRFTAFYLKKPDYLLSTHRSGLPASLHAGSPSSSNTNSTDEREQLLSSMAQTSWLSVQVLHWAIDGTDKTKGEVEFVAFFFDTKRQQQNALPQQLHERSRFVQENKRWYYVDGEFLGTIKLGRNDVCWCGSAKKMKKCHG